MIFSTIVLQYRSSVLGVPLTPSSCRSFISVGILNKQDAKCLHASVRKKTSLSNPMQSDICSWICICLHRYRIKDQPTRPVPTQSEKILPGENVHTQYILTKINFLCDVAGEIFGTFRFRG